MNDRARQGRHQRRVATGSRAGKALAARGGERRQQAKVGELRIRPRPVRSASTIFVPSAVKPMLWALSGPGSVADGSGSGEVQSRVVPSSEVVAINLSSSPKLASRTAAVSPASCSSSSPVLAS